MWSCCQGAAIKAWVILALLARMVAMVVDGGGWWMVVVVVVLSLTGPQQGSPRAVPVHLFFLSRNLLTFTNTISHNHSLKKFYNEVCNKTM